MSMAKDIKLSSGIRPILENLGSLQDLSQYLFFENGEQNMIMCAMHRTWFLDLGLIAV